jgi:hypothetical protein
MVEHPSDEPRCRPEFRLNQPCCLIQINVAQFVAQAARPRRVTRPIDPSRAGDDLPAHPKSATARAAIETVDAHINMAATIRSFRSSSC